MAKKRESIPIVAAFDFDGTITDRDTLLPFLVSEFGWPRVAAGLLKNISSLFGFVIGLTTRQDVKEALLATFFHHMPIEEFARKAHRYSREVLPQYVKQASLDRLQWHLDQGHHCVLISASIDTYLEPWAKKQGFHDLICSRLEVTEAGLVSGKLKGKNCWGAEKVRRLEEHLGPKEAYILYAYGDSDGDKPLLSIADYPFYQKMGE